MIDTIYGMKIYQSPIVPAKEPKLILSNKIDVSDIFRRDYNAWLLEYFGDYMPVYVISGRLYMNPYTKAEMLRTILIKC